MSRLPGSQDAEAFGHWIAVDVDYFNKRTINAFDFDTLFNTPIVFPISWAKSEINGVSGRITVVPRTIEAEVKWTF